MDVRARTTLPAAVTAPAEAREFAREAMRRGNGCVHVDDVTLVVSELVTNAVVHGAGDVTLDVVVADDAVRVEVTDREPDLPEPVDNGADAEAGRGLLIVSRLARQWGVRPEGTGKVVWADLAG